MTMVDGHLSSPMSDTSGEFSDSTYAISLNQVEEIGQRIKLEGPETCQSFFQRLTSEWE